ncbi:MAG: hypothetical protein EOP11_12305 [Proteobacteria bacterium]|nr:MAG: hypothetical protein EOP11_12305 [Pseudomonadota bacterium]
MKKLLLLACTLFALTSVSPAHAADEEVEAQPRRPRQMRKKQPVQLVEEEYADEGDEEVVRPKRVRANRKKQPVQIVEEEDEMEEAPAPRPRARPRYRDEQYANAYEGAYVSGRTSRWQGGFELLGPALAYSFNGSYLFGDHLAVNAGLSAFSVSGGNNSASVFLLPLSVSGLFGGPDSHFEVIGGVTPVFGSSKLSNDEGGLDRAAGTSLFGFAGLGYRYWPSNGGFHFRATLYLMAGGGQVFPWPGFQFGYAF